MRRVGNLFPWIAERKTFSHAANLAARGKRTRAEVRRFFDDFDTELNRLVSLIADGQFRFSDYRQFFIRDPKTRLIHAPPFRDRVVHHAMLHVVGPVFESGAMDTSYACRRGYGHHAALDKARAWTQTGGWFLKLDVERFYDSVDHATLRHLLRRRLREQRLLDLFDRLLESYSTSPGTGLPIGALTSQYLGNFYLDVVDRWVKQTMQVRKYVRYMDDMLLWGQHGELKSVLEGMGPFLENLGLRLNHAYQLNRCELGIPFLGFVVYPNRLRLSRAGRKRLRRRMKRLERAYQRDEIDALELQARSTSIFAHAAFADDIAWRRTVCGFSSLNDSV